MHAGHLTIEPFILPWAPAVVHKAIPSDAAYASQPVAVYASSNDYAFNYGHALFDFLYAVFNQLQTLQLYTPDFQLLLAQHQVASPLSIRSIAVVLDLVALLACCSMQGAHQTPEKNFPAQYNPARKVTIEDTQ